MVVNLQAWFIDELRLGNTGPTTTLLSMRGIPGLLESLLRPQLLSPANAIGAPYLTRCQGRGLLGGPGFVNNTEGWFS